MITVSQAQKIILQQVRSYGTDAVSFTSARGRVLAEDITTDRDLPPYNRVTMDGIAISHREFANGRRSFRIRGTMAAGDAPIITEHDDECIELMTGAALPDTTDTVVRYEDTMIKDGVATILIDEIKKGQNIHRKGKDKHRGATVVSAGTVVDATVISMAASVGKPELIVRRLPRIVIISTGDELVDVNDQPTEWQVRRSNNYAINAVLQQYNITADMLHIADDAAETKERIQYCLSNYDVLLLSGGISMGKFDYVPKALEEAGVSKLFHKVQQRPGKPFWFGMSGSSVVFAFPGNPVSAFMCLHRYFLPWLHTSLGISGKEPYAILAGDFTFEPALQCFVQVKTSFNEMGQLLATPAEGNGSGDFANLLDADAFMELPAEKSIFKQGEVYRIWPFKQLM